MSWGVIIPKDQGTGGVTTAATFAADAEAAWAAYEPSAAEQQAFEAAVAAAESIIASGVVGPADAGLTVQFAGHANADHLPNPPNANDYVTITVTQARVPA
jgi:hypothetical protein